MRGITFRGVAEQKQYLFIYIAAQQGKSRGRNSTTPGEDGRIPEIAWSQEAMLNIPAQSPERGKRPRSIEVGGLTQEVQEEKREVETSLERKRGGGCEIGGKGTRALNGR